VSGAAAADPAPRPHVIWLNGPFGGGKTTTAEALCALVPETKVFDPERIGELLAEVLPVPTGDFQDLPSWRRLVGATIAELVPGLGGGPLVVPMTVLRATYLDEIFGQLRDNGISVSQVLLDAVPITLLARIDAADPDLELVIRESRVRWRREHVARYLEARPDLVRRSEILLDVGVLAPADVARRIGERFNLASALKGGFRSET
jgi:hypothetical protein